MAQSLKRNRLILTTKEEVKPTLQGDVMTVGELAEFLQLHPSMRWHPSAIYRLLRRGKLPAFKARLRLGLQPRSHRPPFPARNPAIIRLVDGWAATVNSGRGGRLPKMACSESAAGGAA